MLGTEDVTAMLLDTCSVQFDFTNLMIVSENVDKELLQNPSHNTHYKSCSSYQLSYFY